MLSECSVFNSSSPIHHGFIQGPETRGTLDILWTCLMTFTLAAYTVSHTEIQDGFDPSDLSILKFSYSIVNLFFPEVYVYLSYSNWVAARRNLAIMKKRPGFDNWTISHAFFAAQGGFVTRDKNSEDPKAFIKLSVNDIEAFANGRGNLAAVSKDEMYDKSKADKFVKFLAVVQVGGSKATHDDSRNRYALLCDISLPIIVEDEGLDKKLWRVNTDFLVDTLEEEKTPKIDPMAIALLAPTAFLGNGKRKVAHTYDQRRACFMIVATSSAVNALYAIAWNFSFPTPQERMVWRVFVSFQGGFVVILAYMFWIWWKGWDDRVDEKDENGKTIFRWTNILVYISYVLVLFLGLLVIMKPYFLIQGLIGLRKLPEGAFINVKWENYIPHI